MATSDIMKGIVRSPYVGINITVQCGSTDNHKYKSLVNQYNGSNPDMHLRDRWNQSTTVCLSITY